MDPNGLAAAHARYARDATFVYLLLPFAQNTHSALLLPLLPLHAMVLPVVTPLFPLCIVMYIRVCVAPI
jgi:hypothetical protein